MMEMKRFGCLTLQLDYQFVCIWAPWSGRERAFYGLSSTRIALISKPDQQATALTNANLISLPNHHFQSIHYENGASIVIPQLTVAQSPANIIIIWASYK